MAQNNAAHGKEIRRWCDGCGTLVLGNLCSVCGGSGREFIINSPGDIRPCMGESQNIILGLFEKAFGTSSPLDGRMLFFNKIPGEDRTDEIIAHGEVIGVVRFDIKENALRLDVKQAGAELFSAVASKNVVRFANMSGHLKGKTIPGSNVIEVLGKFSEGDPVIVAKASKVGAGVALTDSDSVPFAERAVKIRDLDNVRGMPLSPPSGRDVFVKANIKHLKDLESSAVSDIRSFMKGKKQPLTVSFSGGKDSLVAYGLAAAATDDLTLLFVNTGLEFPETLDYVKHFSEKSGKKILIADAGNAFWNNVGTFGPPAKDFRWCCKVCKLGPISDLIAEEFPKGTVTVEGNRMLESFARSSTAFVSRNPFVPNQTNLNPVRKWSAAEIWGYIWMKGLDYNPLYDRDFERIGCYLCASCLSSEWRNTGRIHPDMYGEWESFLEEYAKGKGLPKEYVDLGLWRWKVLPPKMLMLTEGLDLKEKSSGGSSVKMLKGASSCAAGGYSMEAIVSVERNRDFSYVEDALRTAGEVKYSPEFEIALLKTPRGKAKLFGGGQVSVTSDTKQNAEYIFEKAVKALIRAEMCTCCGICAKGCARHAIKISGGMRVDPTKCNLCGKCERSCMVVHYYDKIVDANRRKTKD